MKRRLLVILSVVSLVAVGVVLFFPTDEKRVWKVIVRAEKAVVNEDLEELMEQVSFNYRDGFGGSYLTVKKRAESFFERYDDISIDKRLATMSVADGRAAVDLNVLVTATGRMGTTNIAGETGSWQEMRVYLEKSSYQWEIVSVELLFSGNS
jgi:hypothetical protein